MVSLKDELKQVHLQSVTSSDNVTAYEDKIDKLTLSLSEKENRATELEKISSQLKITFEKLSEDFENKCAELKKKDADMDQIKAELDAKITEASELTKKLEEMKEALHTAHKVRHVIDQFNFKMTTSKYYAKSAILSQTESSLVFQCMNLTKLKIFRGCHRTGLHY